MWTTKRNKSQRKKHNQHLSTDLRRSQQNETHHASKNKSSINSVKSTKRAKIPNNNINTSKQDNTTMLNNTTNKSKLFSIEKWLPSLESKYIFPESVNINNNKEKIKALDTIISKLSQKALLLTDPMQSKNYSLTHENKQLLLHGYTKQYAFNYIPTDLIILMWRFYDTILQWVIAGKTMEQFRKCKYKEIMHGPQLNVHDMTFELTLCPMGWYTEGSLACYLELISKPDNIQSVTYMVSMYVKELNCETRRAKKISSIDNGIGLNSKLIKFDTVKLMDCLTIECHAEILYIEYKPSLRLKPLILCEIPQIRDCEYVWNIDDDIWQKIKNTEERWIYQSDNFAEDCLLLGCIVTSDTLKLGLKLLRKPYNVEQYVVKIIWTVYCDNHDPIRQDTKWDHKLNLNDFKCKSNIFKLDEWKDVNVISFRAEIKVIDTERDKIDPFVSNIRIEYA